MNRRAFALIMVVFAASLVGAEEEATPTPADIFFETVDMHASLATLHAALDDPEQLQRLGERILILEGVVASIALYSDDPTDYYAEIELISGSWQGVQRIDLHRAYVVLAEARFAGRLAERPPRDPVPALILRNDRIMLAAHFADLVQDDAGETIPLLYAHEIRAID